MKKFLVASAAMLAASVCSFGATITFTGNFGPMNTTFTQVTPLSQFNPALGTLTGVSFSITGTSSGTESINNISGADGTYAISIATTLTMRDPLNNTLVQVIPVFNDPSFFVPNGTTKMDSGTSAPLTNTASVSAPFTTFIGTGTVAFNVFAQGSSSATGPDPNFTGATTSAVGTDSVIYTYTPATTGTPEPATMGLLGSALIGLGFLKFRTKKS